MFRAGRALCTSSRQVGPYAPHLEISQDSGEREELEVLFSCISTHGWPKSLSVWWQRGHETQRHHQSHCLLLPKNFVDSERMCERDKCWPKNILKMCFPENVFPEEPLCMGPMNTVEKSLREIGCGPKVCRPPILRCTANRERILAAPDSCYLLSSSLSLISRVHNELKSLLFEHSLSEGLIYQCVLRT